MAAAGALVITGCESRAATSKESSTRDVVKAPSADQRRVARVIERLDDAVNRGDARAVCHKLVARESAGKRCVPDLVLLFRQPHYRTFDITVRKVTVRGRRATAKVVLRVRRSSGGERETYSLAKEDGEWRLRLSLGR